jgi:alcohol dehydrogenase class IV
MKFQFATAGQIIFGNGSIEKLPAQAAEIGKRPFIITGSRPERHESVLSGLKSKYYALASEPTVPLLKEAVTQAREAGADCIIGLGGGSAIDMAKAVAALLTNKGDLFDYLEVIGKGRPLEEPALPTIAIPTTSGTGAEVTRNAVLGSPEHQVKVSMRHSSMLPRIALVDPVLTHAVPPDVTANSGLDALTQLIEVFLTRKASPLTDGLVREALPRGARGLPIAFRDGSNAEARQDMSLSSLFSGLGLANAGLGAVHGFAGPLGGMVDIPHGTACAILLAPCMKHNADCALKSGDSALLNRFAELAQMLTGQPGGPSEVVDWAIQISEEVGIGKLSDYGFAETEISPLVSKAKNSSSMKGNPVDLSEDLLKMILKAAM